MKKISGIEKLKTLIFPRQKFSLHELVAGQKYIHHYYMRPTDDHQSSIMIKAHILGHESDWENGGFIFVSKQRAPDVLRILDQIGVQPKIVSLSRAGDLNGLINLSKPGDAWVFVEDDELTCHKRADKMRTVHAILAQKRRALIDAVYNKPIKFYADKFPAKNQRVPIMFIEVTLPFVDETPVVFAQARSLGLCYCVVSRQSQYDDALNVAFGGPDVRDTIRSILPHTVQVYGSGPENTSDLMERFDSMQKWKSQEFNTSQGAIIFPLSEDRPHELEKRSSLGAYFCGSEMRIVDLEN